MDYLQYFRVIHLKMEFLVVLNLIINGLPSIQNFYEVLTKKGLVEVLNLIINGLPSIHVILMNMLKNL